MATGHKVTAAWSSSLVIQKRIAAGEDADLIIMADILGNSLTEELMKQGKLVAISPAIFAKSGIGVAVRFGAPKPDISSAEAVKKSILAAKSIAYSAGASGTYLVSMLQPSTWISHVESETEAAPNAPLPHKQPVSRNHLSRLRAGAAMLSVMTLMTAGLPLAMARAMAPSSWLTSSTSSPCPPSAFAQAS